jgi:hypothetical protein
MGWKFYDESVEVLEQRYCYLPQLFRWRGRYYDVHAVERCWTVVRRRRSVSVQRRSFRVQCGDGTFDLYHDLRVDSWHLRRARLSAPRVYAVRRLLPAWR